MASDDDNSQKLLDKMRANPTVPLGLAGLLGIVTYGLYNFKNKKLKPSIYLIQLRVAAQGTLITCMTLGLVYTLGKNHIHKLFPDKKN